MSSRGRSAGRGKVGPKRGDGDCGKVRAHAKVEGRPDVAGQWDPEGAKARGNAKVEGRPDVAGQRDPEGAKARGNAKVEGPLNVVVPRDPEGTKTRVHAKVEELPAEAREAIDRMLADGDCTHQRIADALAEAGFTITKGAVGRREAGKTAEERMERLFIRQLDGLSRWMEKQSGFDAAGAALSLVIGRLGRRVAGDAGLFDGMPADKAAAALIQAARAATQYEKTASERKKLRAEAREGVVRELREALKREPELWEKIEALAAGEG